MKSKFYKSNYTKIIKLSSSVVNGLVTFTTNLFLPKVLTINEYGLFEYFQTFFTNTINILDSGSSTYFYNQLVKKNNNVGYYFFYSVSIIFILLILGATFNIFNLFSNLNTTIHIVFLSIIHTFLFWLLNILQKFFDANNFTIFSESIFSSFKILNLIILFLFLRNSYHGLELNYVRDIVMIFFIFITSIYFYFRSDFYQNINLFSYSKIEYKDLFYFTKPLFVTAVFNSLLLIWEKSYLIKNSDISQVAIFTVANRLMLFGTFLTVSLSQLYFKDIAEILDSKTSSENIYNFLNNKLYFLFIIASILSVTFLLQAPNLINLLYPLGYQKSAKVLQILSIYPIFHVYGQIANGIFLVNGNSRFYSKLTISAFIFGFVLVYIFISNKLFNLGIYGLSLKIVFVQIVTVIIGINKLSRLYSFNRNKFFYKLFYSYSIIFIIMFTVKHLTIFFFPKTYELYIFLIISTITCLITFKNKFLNP